MFTFPKVPESFVARSRSKVGYFGKDLAEFARKHHVPNVVLYQAELLSEIRINAIKSVRYRFIVAVTKPRS